MQRTVPLGPFHLLEPLAQGGMGEVWRGVHPGQGVPIAVKVIPKDAIASARNQAGFHNEVRAVATLDHPNIVLVFDYAEVDERAARASGGRLVAGSPYLAMELASGGSLTRLRDPLPWPYLRGILLSLLDALAHAHARGVIHRDLKPGNILLCTERDARPGLKISDFGISRAVDRYSQSVSVDTVIGTAHYMAPEQIEGHWRDQGPWTDLYALGCLVHRLAAGQVPYAGRRSFDLLRAQIYEPAPPLESRAPVPEGFIAWTARLLEKDPRDRYRRAADAAADLVALGAPRRHAAIASTLPAELEQALASVVPVGEVGRGAARAFQEMATVALDLSTSTRQRIGDLPTELHEVPPERRGGLPRSRDRVALFPADNYAARAAQVLPDSWRHPLPPAPPMKLRGAGVGLYGLRTVRLVGREAERDRLWEGLRAVHATRSPRLVVLGGPAGVGKSRLAEWLCQRGHELGAATPLRASHGPGDGGGDALARMVARQLRCLRQERAKVQQRVLDWMERQPDRDEAAALVLTELISPLAEADRRAGLRSVRLESPRERHAVVQRFLERLGRFRPIVLWLDDVHWSTDSLAFLEYLLGAGRNVPCPVLLVATVADEALGELPETAQRVDALAAHQDAVRLDLPPLEPPARAALVRELLGLEETLAARVEERTAGNPMFAVQLVGEWAQRGLLRASPSGFVLRSGTTAILPEDVHAVWEERLERLVEGLPPTAVVFLERAAALGQEIDEEEWQEVCDDPGGVRSARFGPGRVVLSQEGLRVRSQLIDRLLVRRLAEETDTGLAFAHGMLREELERSARLHGRWREHHRACAAMLQRRGERGARGLSERMGRHLVAADQLDAALDPLLLGVEEAVARSGVRAALSLLGTCEEVMRELDLGRTDPRWGHAWTLRARLLGFQGDVEQAARWAERAVGAARSYGWNAVLPRALYEIGRTAVNRLDLDRGEQAYLDALDSARRIGDDEMVGQALLGLAVVEGHRGNVGRAVTYSSEAHRVFDARKDDLAVAACLRHLGLMRRREGDLRRAMACNLRAVQICERLGSRGGTAEAVNNAAEIARQMGDLEEAESSYARALDLFEAVGAWQALLAMLNLGLVRLARGRYGEARQVLEEARQEAERQGRRYFIGATHVLLLPCAAWEKDWTAWDRHLRQARQLLEETGFADPDNAWPARLAGDLARAAAEPARAREAWTLARDQYEALGDALKVAELSELLRS